MFNFAANRRAAILRKTALAFSAAALMAVSLASQQAVAYDDLNRMFGGGAPAAPGYVPPAPSAPETAAPGILPPGFGAPAPQNPGLAPNPYVAPQAAPGPHGAKAMKDKELWLAGKQPADHLKIIGSHPLPGENCRQVIFDARPTVPSRHSARQTKRITFDIDRLCLLSFRNDSEDRTMVVRVGQALETLAITPDPDLFSGKVLEPRQQVVVPIRPLPVGLLNIPVEAVWKSDLGKAKPQIDRVNITVSKQSS